jgi:hypothetical protein
MLSNCSRLCPMRSVGVLSCGRATDARAHGRCWTGLNTTRTAALRAYGTTSDGLVCGKARVKKGSAARVARRNRHRAGRPWSRTLPGRPDHEDPPRDRVGAEAAVTADRCRAPVRQSAVSACPRTHPRPPHRSRTTLGEFGVVAVVPRARQMSLVHCTPSVPGASGIDAVPHRGLSAAGKQTVAIHVSGLNCLRPSENRNLLGCAGDLGLRVYEITAGAAWTTV